MKKIPSTRGLFDAFHKVEKSPNNTTRSVTADIVAAAEARMKAQSTLLPKLSDHNHKKEQKSPPDEFIA
jgi:hypothetical protein